MTTVTEALETFSKLAEEAFAGLIAKGFRRIEQDIALPEIWCGFRNSTTQVTTHFELGSGVWTTVSRLIETGGLHIAGEGYDIAYLCYVRSGDRMVRASHPSFNEEALRVALELEAKATLSCAGDCLAGDFALFAQIAPLASQNYIRREEEMFARRKQ